MATGVPIADATVTPEEGGRGRPNSPGRPPADTLRRVTRCPVVAIGLTLLAVSLLGQPQPDADFEKLPFAPRHAICYRTATALVVDGKLDEPAWQATAWSDAFVDIDGVQRPRLVTRMKMLWDDEFFYFGADLEEPHIWATLTARDSVIFQDNDFEVFIDPDGDTHAYYELEVNALNTVWDLFLVQPYRDGGPAIHAWDIAGLKTGVDLRGTINDPADRDDGWSVEIAIPWSILREGTRSRVPPRNGDQWRVNFSRVQWQLDAGDRSYTKRVNPRTGKPFPEDNWVWSPQGAINMHMPERWGFVQFSEAAAGTAAAAFVEDRNERVKWALRRVYYRQREFHASHGRYASDLSMLDVANITVDGLDFTPWVQITDSLYEVRAAGFDGAVVRIRQDGRVWATR
jgi:hypothetical protein